MTLAKFIALVIVAGHWVACMWGLTARTQAGEADRDDEFGHPRNWADQWFDDHPWAERTLWSEYAIAFEFGFCTITSVGFGDVTLITTAEVVIATASVILGAFLWAYLIGNACAVLSALDADASRENQLMDDLNKFTRARRFPEEFRKRLRAYFIYARSLNKESRFVHILECLSPALQAEGREGPGTALRTRLRLSPVSRSQRPVARLSSRMNGNGPTVGRTGAIRPLSVFGTDTQTHTHTDKRALWHTQPAPKISSFEK